MADLIDVLNAFKSTVLAAVYPPAGVVPGNSLSPVTGCAVLAVAGEANANDLDLVAASLAAGQVPRTIVSICAAGGMWRNTTRYPKAWLRQIAGTTTLTLSVDATGTVVTIGGTAPGAAGPAQNVALIVGFAGSRPQGFAYSVLPSDTLDSIASALAALVDTATPASASGAQITIPAAHSLVARVGGVSTMLKEVMRQTDRIQVNVWAPIGPSNRPQLRDAVAGAVKIALAQDTFLTLADQTAARVVTRGDFLLDDPEKAGLFRRLLNYDVEYATTITMPGPIAIVATGDLQGGAAAIADFTGSDPPVVTAQG